MSEILEWNALFDGNNKPELEDMGEYIGGNGKVLWDGLFEYMQNSYKSKPKMFYSGCSGKPGWNVKFQKSGQNFGTLYPEKDGFSVFIVIAYKLEGVMEGIRERLSDRMRDMYDNAPDYMKMGKWMMFRIESETDLNDYKLLISAKMQPREL